MKGGTNVAPELSKVGPVMQKGRVCRRGRRRRRRPGPRRRGNSSVSRLTRLGPKARENAESAEKRGKREKSENGGNSLNFIKFTQFQLFPPRGTKSEGKKVEQNRGWQLSGNFLIFSEI